MRHLALRLALLCSVSAPIGLPSPSALTAQQPPGSAAAAPVPDDARSEEAIIAALYGSISGPAGQRRDWTRFRALFIPEGRLIVARARRDGAQVLPRVMSVEEYVAGSGALDQGFFENELHHVSETFGGVAHRFSTYESRGRADGPVVARGINSIQLLNDGRRWWIVTVFWDSERPTNPIPAKYLGPAPGGA